MKLWPGAVFALLGVNFVLVGVTVYCATSDRSFAVEPDYDQKALHFGDQLALEHASAALGWNATINARANGSGVLSVGLRDRAGEPVRGAAVAVEAFRTLRAARREHWTLAETSPGMYSTDAPVRAGEAWRIRLRADRAADAFVQTAVVTVAGGAPSP